MPEKQAPMRLAAVHKFNVLEGSNYTTVRRGLRWAESEVGDPVELVIQDPVNREAFAVIGMGSILSLEVIDKFRDIPARCLEQEHELSSRTYSGLIESMRRAYGSVFDENDTVTVVTYTVDEFDEDTQNEFVDTHNL